MQHSSWCNIPVASSFPGCQFTFWSIAVSPPDSEVGLQGAGGLGKETRHGSIGTTHGNCHTVEGLLCPLPVALASGRAPGTSGHDGSCPRHAGIAIAILGGCSTMVSAICAYKACYAALGPLVTIGNRAQPWFHGYYLAQLPHHSLQPRPKGGKGIEYWVRHLKAEVGLPR